MLKAAENLTENFKRYANSADWPHIHRDVLSTLGISDEDYRDLADDYMQVYEG
ncbi:MAG: hypothetical protein MK214_03390 [Thalassotalea sp.]|nr:hypothetical protein [Thalassotalea sp.]